MLSVADLGEGLGGPGSPLILGKKKKKKSRPYNFYNVGFENLVLDQLIIPKLIPKLIFLFTLITCLLDIVLILYGEILFWSLMEVKGLRLITVGRALK